MGKPKRKQVDKTVTLSVSYNELRLAVRSTKNGPITVRTNSVTWRQASRTLHSEDGQRELAAGLKRLLQNEHLSGASVQIALSSDFCVTRVVAGDNERVDTELQEMADRSALYLSLGTGHNAMAESRRPIDARTQQAWLTVANQRTLEAVAGVVESAGLHVERVEHSVVALCRAVGKLGLDHDDPLLIIEITHRGVELAISYQGLLLLDYRPGGRDSQVHIGKTVQTHMKRLHRYCDRHFRFAKRNKLNRAVLFGSGEDVESVKRQFEEETELEPVVIRPEDVQPEWQFEHQGTVDPLTVTAVGTLLVATDPSQDHTPNIMDHLLGHHREPLLPALFKAAWPVAAALLLTVGILGATWHERSQCADLEQDVLSLHSAKLRVTRLQREMADAQSRLEHLTRIDGQTAHPAWHEVVAGVGSCLPEACWLERLTVQGNGQAVLTGSSHNEDAVFEFVRYLKRLSILRNVALEGTQPVRTDDGPATRFDISCLLSELANIAKGR